MKITAEVLTTAMTCGDSSATIIEWANGKTIIDGCFDLQAVIEHLTGEHAMSEYSYRKRTNIVNAFKWDGDMNNVPAWAMELIRNMQFNEATDPPGLVLSTLAFGNINVSYEHWFVYDTKTGNVFTRTDEAFKRDYEPNT